MGDNHFQAAAAQARRSFTADEWDSLTFHEQSDAIYRELRRLDAAVVAVQNGMHSSTARQGVRLQNRPPTEHSTRGLRAR